MQVGSMDNRKLIGTRAGGVRDAEIANRQAGVP